MRQRNADQIWADNVNQSPKEFLRECTAAELKRGTLAIGRDFVRNYDAEYRAAGLDDAAIADIAWAIGVLLVREMTAQQFASDAR